MKDSVDAASKCGATEGARRAWARLSRCRRPAGGGRLVACGACAFRLRQLGFTTTSYDCNILVVNLIRPTWRMSHTSTACVTDTLAGRPLAIAGAQEADAVGEACIPLAQVELAPQLVVQALQRAGVG